MVGVCGLTFHILGADGMKEKIWAVIGYSDPITKHVITWWPWLAPLWFSQMWRLVCCALLRGSRGDSGWQHRLGRGLHSGQMTTGCLWREGTLHLADDHGVSFGSKWLTGCVDWVWEDPTAPWAGIQPQDADFCDWHRTEGYSRCIGPGDSWGGYPRQCCLGTQGWVWGSAKDTSVHSFTPALRWENGLGCCPFPSSGLSALEGRAQLWARRQDAECWVSRPWCLFQLHH